MFHVKPDCRDKKHVLRYPEDRIPETRIEQIPPLVLQDSKDKLEEPKVEVPAKVQPKVDLAVPKLNTALYIEKKIKRTEDKTAKKIQNVSDLCQPQKVTYDEKITKQMNFPFDKKLYKELISLNLNPKTTVQQPPTTFEPVLRDKVPNLSDYFTPPPNLEYSIPVKSTLGSQTATKQFDGLRMDKVIRTWKECRPD